MTIQARDAAALPKGGSSRGKEKGLDPGYILEVKSPGYPDMV